ncbi:muscarinic acetylcholine receptor M3-like [Amphiura filiformis]|uniref:muscarinic acetylcholine receptor M3-like n=1 Tax=Amphiura filiformis TaxID=82378 RepID=UPI003B21A3DB
MASSTTSPGSWSVITFTSIESNTIYSSELFTSNLTTHPGGQDRDDHPIHSGLSRNASISVAVFSFLISFITVFGNIVIIHAFCTIKKLQTYTNYFLVSLAISDIVAGAITMPLYSVYWILGYWPFSNALCDAYLYLNHSFIHISVMSIVIIAYDRWQALEMPIKHLRKRTLKHAIFLITLSYMIPFLIWLPICLLWPYMVGIRTIKPGLCYPQYVDNLIFTCFAPCIFFWFPLLFISVFYGRIFVIIRKSAERRSTRRRPLKLTNLSNAMSTSLTVMVDENDKEHITRDKSVTTVDGTLNNDGHYNNAYAVEDMGKGSHQNQATWFRNIFRHDTPEDSSIKKENIRANKTLTLIFIAMVMSSAPWSALVPVFSMCHECIPLALYQVSL